MRTLTAPSSSRSRLTVPWVATMPSVARSSTSWTWLEMTCSWRYREIRCWRCGLPTAIRATLLEPFRQLGQHGPVRVHAVPGLGPDGRGRTVEHLVGDLLAP